MKRMFFLLISMVSLLAFAVIKCSDSGPSIGGDGGDGTGVQTTDTTKTGGEKDNVLKRCDHSTAYLEDLPFISVTAFKDNATFLDTSVSRSDAFIVFSANVIKENDNSGISDTTAHPLLHMFKAGIGIRCAEVEKLLNECSNSNPGSTWSSCRELWDLADVCVQDTIICYKICNFPEYLKDIVYLNGSISFTTSGKVFEPSWVSVGGGAGWRGPKPLINLHYNLELTSITINRKE